MPIKRKTQPFSQVDWIVALRSPRHIDLHGLINALIQGIPSLSA